MKIKKPENADQTPFPSWLNPPLHRIGSSRNQVFSGMIFSFLLIFPIQSMTIIISIICSGGWSWRGALVLFEQSPKANKSQTWARFYDLRHLSPIALLSLRLPFDWFAFQPRLCSPTFVLLLDSPIVRNKNMIYLFSGGVESFHTREQHSSIEMPVQPSARSRCRDQYKLNCASVSHYFTTRLLGPNLDIKFMAIALISLEVR